MSMIDSVYIFLIFFAYLIGSIPFGKIVASSYGIDIQKRGSGNIGFANVRRVIGWQAGLITLAGDILKGLVPALIGLLAFNETAAFWFGVSAIIGHVFPIWLRFRGGKGIATGLGLLTVLNPVAAATGTLVYIFGGAVLRRSSTASLLGLAVAACVAIVLAPSTWWQYIVLVSIALWTLRHNIQGTVPRYDT